MPTVLGQPTSSSGACQGDNLVITPGGATTTSPSTASPPTLCGTLTGQHGTKVHLNYSTFVGT